MKFELISLSEAQGRILGHNIAGSDGHRLLRKGKPLTREDIERLRTLGRKSVCVVRLEEGDVDLLKREMSRLKRSCHRLIWLNPLLGAPDYEPLTGGIQATLPHIDDFLPIHNLASLEDLVDRLAEIDHRSNGGNLARYPA